jgi:hypothetical protein
MTYWQYFDFFLLWVNFKNNVIASAAWQSPTYRGDLPIGDCHVVPPRNDGEEQSYRPPPQTKALSEATTA